MNAVRPSAVALRIRPLWFALAWVLLAAGPAAAQFLSPGPIDKAHHEIDGDDACNRCHERGEGVPDRLCVDCHRPIQARVSKGTGYHGHTAKSQTCASCHEEHLGKNGHLVRWPGGSPEAFNHAQAGWPLTGKHAEAKCRDCHTAKLRAEANLPADTYLGLPTACKPCHQADDPHKGQFGERRCDTCHTTAQWKPLTDFNHEKTRFPLRDKHTEVKCEKCHEKGRYAEVPRQCQGCHETPHPKPTEFGEQCDRCHVARGWATLTYAKADHKKFPLEGGHATPKCTDCHGAKAALAPPKACFDCHKQDDAHKGGFGRKCENCHQIADWKRLKKGANIDHDKTAFPLRGGHIGVACESCHEAGRFKPVAHERCLDCHKDPHRGVVGTKCEACHVVDGYRPSTYRLEQHTTFALTGAHRAVACDACHRPAPAAGARPQARKGPPEVDFRKGAAACTDCHRDAHEGQFAPRLCTDCHTTTAWTGAFKHDAWPLAGRHATTACASCHDNGRYEGTPTACRDCHGDPHLGQFLSGPEARRADCQTCHTAETWKGRFDAAAHAKVWPLEGAHARAECKACHQEVSVGDGRATVRYRLGFTDCARCHENVHAKGQAEGAQAGAFARCADCHTPEAWHRMRSGGADGFDHDPTGFPLRGRHVAVVCTDCHQGKPLRGARCATCHEDPHRARQGDRCDTCHSTRDWRLPDALAQHNRSRFPLQGAHLTAECRECHRFAAQNVWKGADTRCASCHREELALARHPAHDRPPFTTACDACHTPFTFARAEIDHGRWWPLTGAHRTADCGQCHAGSRYTGTPSDCVQCHRDDFQAAHEAGESTACAACHATTSWSQVQNLDHSRFFPLPHRGVSACASCHPTGSESLSCMTCHTHSRARMDGQHDEVRGYAFEARACYRCHPKGRD